LDLPGIEEAPFPHECGDDPDKNFLLKEVNISKVTPIGSGVTP
jgi:hypothetical protein